MALIEVQNLDFEYPDKKILQNINFQIAEGSVTALVGPNGAGKTTLLRCLSSLETPLSGTVTINGLNVHDHPRESHRHIGYLSDYFGLYEDLTVRQCLTYMAWCQKVDARTVPDKIKRIADDVDITEYLDEKTESLSRGYLQRLGIGLTLVHDPKLLLLDEPASGMDPEARIRLSSLMLRLKERGITIIVSSHILAELEDYCTDMLVIRDGEIKSHVILKEHEKTTRTILRIETLNPLTAEHLSVIEKFTGISGITVTDTGIECHFQGDRKAQADLIVYLVEQKIPVNGLFADRKTLKSAYMDLSAEKGTAST